ncbi:LOW QUALITY PROTEIN: lebercilin-like protein [Centropristis striata]|uniref:LOW QUALITY PROTEIN: lebercilin-like protein n=1 Tax=Centropristis striata TaxID=184440 RepID=UPI0027DF1A03|nr:LOW QUALITY PROTEIN: lebercilin-like protein [Centropristis striata]
MFVRQLSPMQQAIDHNKDGDGDAVSRSTDTSWWSSPSRQRCSSNNSAHSSDSGDLLPDKIPQVKTPDKWQGSNTCGRKKGKNAQRPHKPTTNYAANREVLKLPPIKPLQVSKPQIQSANLTCIRELKSQVWDLQQQLSEARTENKLLKRLQHRHMVALQHFQDSEGSLSQIITKHSNEARVLQQLLRETRACRDNLARQLQTTEKKLLSTKSTLQHLQLLSQDHSLLEREELTFRLARASAELKDKDKRILDLEKNLELSQASFNRQIVTEQRKINEARKISCYLQEQIYQLNKGIEDRERELEMHNIYSHRFLKGSSKKGSESKTVQTDGLVLLHTGAESLLDSEYTETEEKLEKQEHSVNWCCYNPVQESLVIENPETEASANVTLKENHQEDTETWAETSEQSSSEESPENQTERDCDEEKEMAQVKKKSGKQRLKEEWKTEDQESETFRDITRNLQVLEECKIDQHEAEVSDVSEVSPNTEQSSSEESPENQTRRDCDEEKEVAQMLKEEWKTEDQESETSYISENLQVLEECKIDQHESDFSDVSEASLNITEPKRKGYKLPKIRHNYTFKQSIENLHSGRPAYSSVGLSPCQSTKSPIKVENLSHGIHDLFLPAVKSRRGGAGCPQGD